MKKQQSLYLARPLVNKILAHAQQHPNREICGLIGGCTEDGIKEYYPIDNVSKIPHCRFLMDAPQQIKIMKRMREKQQTLYAIVHSHTTSGAEPSALDISENQYTDAFYLIISLNTKGVLEMRAYVQQQTNKQSEASMQEIDLILEHT